MSRSGYDDDGDDQWAMIRYRGMVASAARGKRGQRLLRDILIGMNGLVLKHLIADELETVDGAVCALGAAGKLRSVDMTGLDPDDPETVAGKFNISDCLVREIVYENDENSWSGEYETVDYTDRWGRRQIYRRQKAETPEQRYIRMRRWLRREIKDPLFDVVWC